MRLDQVHGWGNLGADSTWKLSFPKIGIPAAMIRLSWNRLIFKMGIALLVRMHLHIETGPCFFFFVFFFWGGGLWMCCRWPLVNYEKLRVGHAPGMPGTFFSPPRICDPDIYHDSCVTHVPWCMPGSPTSGFIWSRWREKRSRRSRRMRNPQFYVSGKRSWSSKSYNWPADGFIVWTICMPYHVDYLHSLFNIPVVCFSL